MSDDFSKYPQTIGEARSSKSGEGEDWSARDALIHLLRQIDSGEMKVDRILAFYEGEGRPGWIAGGAGPYELAGVAAFGLGAYVDACRGKPI